MDKQQSNWVHAWDLAIKAAALAGAAIAFFWVVLPERQDGARIAAAELRAKAAEVQVKEVAIKQSQYEERLKEANAKLAEHDADQLTKPAVQVSTELLQSYSVEDIREIRLSMIVTNLGKADATINRITVRVDDGSPNDYARDLIARTRDYYYLRTKVRPIADTPAVGAVETAGLFADAQNTETADTWRLPPHENCPHGRIFAIGDTSPDIRWVPNVNATQTQDRQLLLRPDQSFKHEFLFLLTEYPLQHNRQWIRFRVNLLLSNGDTQDYSILVSGLPMTPETMETRYTTMSPVFEQRTRQIVPLMPVNPPKADQ